MDLRNKFQAFVLMPGIIMLVAWMLYFIFTLGKMNYQGVIPVIAAPLILCWVCNPFFEINEYKEMFYEDAEMPLKDKIMKYRPTLAGYAAITIGIAVWALIMHHG
ncbi:Uncharacterised protein [Niallia circulans]|uniref:Uncharacterized protein n=2 Tax=Shouchella clausii TaxID=79880 RepID=A0A268RYX4_SHOCL|nr:hypothetical protein [Shouchella clausii]PAD43207.1 hypothetical protein CHH54_08125 [Bacillus sp. 7520-S]SPT81018.1 Uncharacterised protein [Niallia circulans]AST96640.1 hypothetical protein BC8716_12035 [Shouchella clausii]MEB5471240.1 hypothetical protein [Shouchella clausii]MED4159099.1 hypothetical protein [Shouchella clausii]